MADILKKMIPKQSEFSHKYASWSNNHNGWSKMKKLNKKLAKKRFNREMNMQMKSYENELEREED